MFAVYHSIQLEFEKLGAEEGRCELSLVRGTIYIHLRGRLEWQGIFQKPVLH
jgi:hypothetical protein